MRDEMQRLFSDAVHESGAKVVDVAGPLSRRFEDAMKAIDAFVALG